MKNYYDYKENLELGYPDPSTPQSVQIYLSYAIQVLTIETEPNGPETLTRLWYLCSMYLCRLATRNVAYLLLLLKREPLLVVNVSFEVGSL